MSLNTTGRHPSTQAVARFFAWEHLPSELQVISMPFGRLAQEMIDALPDDPELVVGLRKLLEAKDACVRLASQSR